MPVGAARAGIFVGSGIAIPDSGVDNFEEILYEEEGNGLTDLYAGDTGSFSRQQTTVFEGNYALQSHDSDASVAITSTSGLNAYPSKGDSFRWRIYASDNEVNTSSFVWGVPSESGALSLSGYIATLEPINGKFRIRRFDNGGIDTLTSSFDSPPVGEWLEYQVDWGTDDTHTVTVYDESGTQITSLSATDATYDTASGVGWFHNANSNVRTYYDITELL